MRLLLAALVALVLLAGNGSLRGQDDGELASWAPSTVGAWLELSLDDPAALERGLNRGLFSGAFLQPVRPAPEEAVPLDAFFPLNMLDLETASFSQLVLPWVGDRVGIAWEDLDLTDTDSATDPLLILPARDSFAAAANLSAVLAGQDLLQSEVTDSATVYQGDRSTIAITPSTVLIGPDAMVREALSAHFTDAPSLAESTDYGAIRAGLPAEHDLQFFARGAAAASALPALMSLNGEAGALLESYGAALGGQPASAVLQGQADALGVALDLPILSAQPVRAEVAVLAPEADAGDSAAFSERVLSYVPRRAMLVLSAADGATLADLALTALPYGAAGPALLNTLPLQLILPAGAVPLPSAADAQFALQTLETTLEANGIDLADLRDALNGSGVVALLPRPNNPLPGTGARADVLVAVESERAPDIADGVTVFLDLLNVTVETQTSPAGEVRFTVAAEGSTEPLLAYAVTDGVFLLGTGGALDEALRAGIGDNQLVGEVRWADAGAPAPGLYLDMDRLYNAFLGGPTGGASGPVTRLGITGTTDDAGLLRLSAVASAISGN